MAEKYGTIPKRFTKDWFDYVWTYYKWHIVIPLCVMVFVLYTAYECTHRTQYDAYVIYGGHRVFTEEQIDEIEGNLSRYAVDTNDDGEVLVSFLQINFSDQPGMEEMDYNLQMKLDLQLQTNASYAYIFDKAQLDLMIGREEEDVIYLPVDKWGVGELDENLLYTKNGAAYAVYLGNNEKVKALGIKNDDIYMVIKQNYSKKEVDISNFENAKRMASALVSE